MKKSGLLWIATAIVGVAIILVPGAVAQGGETGVTGAAEAAFPDGAMLSGVSLSSLEVGTGASIDSDGNAVGHVFAVLHGTLIGQPRDIVVDAELSSGSVASADSATLSGTAMVDMGDGTGSRALPFSVTATTNGLLLTLAGSALPAATLTGGSITIE